MSKNKPAETLPFDRVLTINASDYFLINQKNPADYRAFGIHFVCGIEFDSCGKYASQAPSPLEAFIAQVPKGVEVVVCYRTSVSVNQRGGVGNPTTVGYTASGTALIPRKIELSEHR
jgi:hypothetical protein